MIDVLPAEPNAAPSSAHLLPCEIEWSGDAIVSAYFKPTQGKRSHEAAFRGRGLKGVTLKPPAGYTGALRQDTKQATVADGEERRWLHRGAIEAITTWKHDEVPHENEPLFKAMRWAGIADVLHADHGDGDHGEAPEPEAAVDSD